MDATLIVVHAMRRVDPWIETHCESDIPHLTRPALHTPSLCHGSDASLSPHVF